jgi:hypothetical protein
MGSYLGFMFATKLVTFRSNSLRTDQGRVKVRRDPFHFEISCSGLDSK